MNIGTGWEKRSIKGGYREKCWKTESFGIQSEESNACQSVKEFVNVRRNGQRYEVELPFKDDCLRIPVNYNLCYNRLKSTHFKLSKTQAYYANMRT